MSRSDCTMKKKGIRNFQWFVERCKQNVYRYRATRLVMVQWWFSSHHQLLKPFNLVRLPGSQRVEMDSIRNQFCCDREISGAWVLSKQHQCRTEENDFELIRPVFVIGVHVPTSLPVHNKR
jgi:hypothetical protein